MRCWACSLQSFVIVGFVSSEFIADCYVFCGSGDAVGSSAGFFRSWDSPEPSAVVCCGSGDLLRSSAGPILSR